MIDEILIERGLVESRVALVAEGRLVEVLIEPARRPSLVGDVYLARVSRVVPGLQAAFLDLGLARDGFLHAREARFAPAAKRREGEAALPIERCVREGEAIYVQVMRDGVGDKGVRLTTRLSLPGRYLVYTPGRGRAAVSRRIAEEGERARLEGAVAELDVGDGGLVVRTEAEGAEAEALAAEAARLAGQWRDIAASREATPVPTCVRQELDAVGRTLRDHAGGRVARILVDSPETLEAARRQCADLAPELAERVALHAGPEPLFERHEVEAEIAAALEPRVALPSGGAIVIEGTEALTAIDVDGGGSAEGRGRREAALDVNLEAAREAARQLRLRGIGGLVVIDFIQMAGAEDGAQVMAALRRALAADRAPVRAAGLSEFGLAEITRKRVGESLARLLTEPCAACEGGRVATVEAVLAALLRRAERESRAAPGGTLELRAAPEVAARLEGGDALLSALEARLGRRVALAAEPGYPRERFDVAVA